MGRVGGLAVTANTLTMLVTLLLVTSLIRQSTSIHREPNQIYLNPTSHQFIETSLDAIIQQSNELPFPHTERMRIINTADLLFREFNPNLLYQQNVLGLDASTHFKRLRRRSARFSNFDFHMEMKRIFALANDYHTLYLPPLPLSEAYVTLGVFVQAFFPPHAATESYMVSAYDSVHPTNSSMPIGCIITAIDGNAPRSLALQLSTDSYAANKASSLRRGQLTLTERFLARDRIPNADFAVLDFITPDGEKRTITLPWRYYMLAPSPHSDTLSEGPPHTDPTPANQSIVTDEPVTTLSRRKIYMGSRMLERHAEARERSGRPSGNLAALQIKHIDTYAQNGVTPLVLTTSSGEIGYVRMHSLSFDAGLTSLQELSTILSGMPSKGLVLDLRGNTGGVLQSVISVFELLTGLHPGVLPIVLRASALRERMAADGGMFESLQKNAALFGPAVTSAIGLGDSFTGPIGDVAVGLPGFPDRFKRAFFGPVVTVTDGETFSAGEVLAALMKDVAGGRVIGLEGSTSGGGCTVSTFADGLSEEFPRVFGPAFPSGVDFNMAAFRIFRSGSRSGGSFEAMGVEPDEVYRYTEGDVTGNGAPFMEYVASLFD